MTYIDLIGHQTNQRLNARHPGVRTRKDTYPPECHDTSSESLVSLSLLSVSGRARAGCRMCASATP
jgi:hypothetical protein